MPKTFPYREALPYETEDSTQSLDRLQKIVEGLYAAIKGDDLKGAMGLGTGSVVVHWTRELRSWMKLKHEMPLATRIKLTKCYYDLALACTDSNVLERFVNVILLLWKNRVIRSSVPPSQVGLDWRRLLRALRKTTLVHTSPYDGNVTFMIGLLARLCYAIRPLIPAEAVKPLTSEVLAVLSITQSASMITTLNIFVLMFPALIHEDPLPGYSSKELFPTLFHVWQLLPPGPAYDAKAIEMISVVAQSEACRPNTIYGPYGVLNHEQMATVFSGILRLLDIPVSGRQSESRQQAGNSARHIAALLIASLSNYPDSTHSTMDMLEGLIHTAESFTHPSSTGSWTFDIIKLVGELVELFTLRWNVEQQGESHVPADRHLSPELRHRFVKILTNTVFYGIHSKSKVLSTLSVVTLQQLAYLEPDLILPGVLSLAYGSIQGLHETHRRLTSLSTLTQMLRLMAPLPKYAIHITTLLELALPCIDPNDMAKTVHALALFQTAGFSVPFVDISGDLESMLASKYLPEIVAHLEDTGELLELDPDILDDLVKSTSFAFNEIAPSLLDRLFLLLENMPENSTKTKQSPEYMVVHNLPTTLMAVLNSVSVEIYERLFEKLLGFITSQVIHPVTDTVAHICGAFVRANPEYAFPRLVKMLDANIRYEVTENKAGSTRNLAPRDRALIWYLSIYNMALAAAGSQVFAFKTEIADLTLFLRQHTRGQTVYHTSNTVHHAIVTLISTYAMDFNFVPKGTVISTEHWGYQPDPQELRLNWHVPSLEEVNFAVELYTKHVELSMDAVQSLLETPPEALSSATDFSDAISYNLIYVRTATSAIASLVDADNNSEPAEWQEPDELDPRDLWKGRYFEANYFLNRHKRESAHYGKSLETEPIYTAVLEMRERIGKFLLTLHDTLRVNHANDITSFKEVLFVLKVWFSDTGLERSARVDHHHKLMYDFESRYFQIPGLRKKLPRTVLARRAQLYHQERLVYNAAPRTPTATEIELLGRLVDSAFSTYPDIRRHAEAALYASLKVLIRGRAIVYPRILATIDRYLDEKDFKAVESGFRLLSYRSMSSMVKRDQQYILTWLQTVLKAVQADNHQLNLQAFETFNDSASDAFRMSLEISHYDDEAVDVLDVKTDLGDVIQKVSVSRQRKSEKTVEAMDKVVAAITSEPLDKLHWRAALVSIVVLLHLSSAPRYAEDPRVLATLSQGVLSSHPDIKRLCLHGFSRAAFQRYYAQLINHNYDAMRLDAPPLRPESQVLVSPPVSGAYYTDYGPLNPSYPGQAVVRYGWLVWPSQVPVQDPVKVCATPKGDDFLSFEFLDQFFERQRLEPRSEEDQFDVRAAIVWGQVIAQCDEETPLNMKSVITFIDKLQSESSSGSEDRNWHRAVAEVVYGALQAQPFLTATQSKALLSSIADLMQNTVLNSLSHENLGYWLSLTKWAYLSIDARRIAPVTATLAAARVAPESGLRDSFKLALHSNVIFAQGWQYNLDEDLATDLWANLTHPLESVRSEVATQLAAIMSSRYHEGLLIDEFVSANRAAGPLGSSPPCYDDAAVTVLQSQFSRLEKLRQEPGSTQVDSTFRVLAKALVVLLRKLLCEPAAKSVVPLLPSLVLPALLAVSTIRDDADLVSGITTVFQMLSSLVFPLDVVDAVLDVLTTTLRDATWHQKVRALLFVQAFYFRQMFSMSQSQRGRVAEIVLAVLADPQVEVRELAAETLSGIVRCSPPREQQELTTKCTERFSRALESTRRRPDLAARHAAVLGLGALVNAYPYASPPPPWVPSVLATLAVKASSDGGVVGKSVKATLGDFKKTRQDTWHTDQLAFTADQLDDLEGVLWKNYFV